MNPIYVTTGHSQGEITEKKSRFLADVYGIRTEEEATQLLDSVRKKYYDARHHCFAYILGRNQEIMRFSDDKEPQGTAGKPILELLKARNLCNTLIVVTRYFGGILLGTGGLTRAYSQAAQAGVDAAAKEGVCCEVYDAVPMQVSCDYRLFGKVQYLAASMELPICDTVYDTGVTLKLIVPAGDASSFTKKITEATNASAIILQDAPGTYILSGQTPVPYSFITRSK